MQQRFVVIWFLFLKTDWAGRQQPALRSKPLVLVAPDHGRMIITAANDIAVVQGIHTGMVLADARVLCPTIEILVDKPLLAEKLLKGLAAWCIRYSPVVAIHPDHNLVLDATGCAHLWGGEALYIQDIVARLKTFGYHVRISMAGTIGAAWAMARYGSDHFIVPPQQQSTALLSLPVEALRIETPVAERLHALGLKQIGNIISMQRSALRRRFGSHLLQKLDQAAGNTHEVIEPVCPTEPYQERLPCLEPIVSATGIEIALKRLLDSICHRLTKEQKGLRMAACKCCRTDGTIATLIIGTHQPSANAVHLFNLFQTKIESLDPEPGIDVFILEAKKIESTVPVQEKLWQKNAGLQNTHLSELIDRLCVKLGDQHIHRYLPDEHHWPERSFKRAASLNEQPAIAWKTDRPRPLQLLSMPEHIEVMAPVPDYPPMHFRYKGKLHKIIKADGPERIEQEWWLQQGQHRDYYYVEDEEGKRYWLFRLGFYTDASYQWFIHGFFA